MAKLQAQTLRKQYRNKVAVENVSLHVESGEIVGLLGPNGAGKTTTFYMIVGLLHADAGAIHLDQTELTNAPMHQRARAGIGYLPQEASVFRKLSTEDNLLAILELRAARCWSTTSGDTSCHGASSPSSHERWVGTGWSSTTLRSRC